MDTKKDTYYQRNREAVLARRKAHRAANPEHYKETGRRQMARWRATNPRVSKSHGLTSDQVAARLQQQGGKCAICGVAQAKWHGDHDHVTGKFRSVLCSKCNMGLGLFNDDPDRMTIAVAYLRRHSEIAALL